MMQRTALMQRVAAARVVPATPPPPCAEPREDGASKKRKRPAPSALRVDYAAYTAACHEGYRRALRESAHTKMEQWRQFELYVALEMGGVTHEDLPVQLLEDARFRRASGAVERRDMGVDAWVLSPQLCAVQIKCYHDTSTIGAKVFSSLVINAQLMGATHAVIAALPNSRVSENLLTLMRTWNNASRDVAVAVRRFEMPDQPSDLVDGPRPVVVAPDDACDYRRFTARGYQLAAAHKGRDGGRLQMACGTGKTLVMYLIMNTRPGRYVVVVPLCAIAAQAARNFRASGLRCAVAGDAHATITTEDIARTQVVVCVRDSLSDVVAAWPADAELAMVMLDEAHLQHHGNERGQAARRFADAHDAALLELTATPRGWGDAEPDYAYPVATAVRDGWLCDYTVLALDIGAGDPLRICAEHVRDHLEGAPYLMVCSSRARVARCLALLRELGVRRAESVDCDTPSRERERRLRDVRAGTLHALVVCRTCTTGVDLPLLTSVCFVDHRSSEIEAMQAWMRALRMHELKSHARVVFPLREAWHEDPSACCTVRSLCADARIRADVCRGGGDRFAVRSYDGGAQGVVAADDALLRGERLLKALGEFLAAPPLHPALQWLADHNRVPVSGARKTERAAYESLCVYRRDGHLTIARDLPRAPLAVRALVEAFVEKKRRKTPSPAQATRRALAWLESHPERWPKRNTNHSDDAQRDEYNVSQYLSRQARSPSEVFAKALATASAAVQARVGERSKKKKKKMIPPGQAARRALAWLERHPERWPKQNTNPSDDAQREEDNVSQYLTRQVRSPSEVFAKALAAASAAVQARVGKKKRETSHAETARRAVAWLESHPERWPKRIKNPSDDAQRVESNVYQYLSRQARSPSEAFAKALAAASADVQARVRERSKKKSND